MAYCANCGKKLNEEAKFCSGCGKAVEATPVLDKPVASYSGYKFGATAKESFRTNFK